MSGALDTFVLSANVCTPKPAIKSGNGWRVICPFHGGKKHSLYASDGTDRLLLHCHSHQCDAKDIMESVGLTIKDIYFEQLTPRERVSHKKIINERKLRAEIVEELRIIYLWCADKDAGAFPRGENDIDRVKAAMKLLNKVTSHYIKWGV